MIPLVYLEKSHSIFSDSCCCLFLGESDKLLCCTDARATCFRVLECTKNTCLVLVGASLPKRTISAVQIKHITGTEWML